MMNLKIDEIKVGDKFKEVKKLGGYDFIGKEFEVEKINKDESAILLSLNSPKIGSSWLSMCQVYLSIDELNNYFEQAKILAWGGWEEVTSDFTKYPESFNPYYYKTNGKLVYVKTTWHNKVFKCKAACHIDDINNFDVNVGIGLAIERVDKKIRDYCSKYCKEINKIFKIGDRVQTIWDEERDLTYVPKNAIGTIKKVKDTMLFVEWDKNYVTDNSIITGNTWWIGIENVELIKEENILPHNFKLIEVNEDLTKQPAYYSILHTLYGNCNGEAVGLSKTIIDMFDVKKELIAELNYLKELADYFNDNDDMLGDIVTYSYKNVITMITKVNRQDKVEYNTVRRGLFKLKKHMEENNIHYLAMPRICCGYEKLKWNEIRNISTEVFKDCIIPITIKDCYEE